MVNNCVQARRANFERFYGSDIESFFSFRFMILPQASSLRSCHLTFTEKKFVDLRLQFDSRIHGHKNVTIAIFTDQVSLGYLDVAIAKKNCQ